MAKYSDLQDDPSYESIPEGQNANGPVVGAAEYSYCIMLLYSQTIVLSLSTQATSILSKDEPIVRIKVAVALHAPNKTTRGVAAQANVTVALRHHD